MRVCNPGGRLLDRSSLPPDLLVAARAAVGDEVPLLVDAGIRTGRDLVTPVALGADLGPIRRPYLCGRAAGGEEGTALAVQMIGDEMEGTMQLLGVGGTAELRAVGEELVSLDGGLGGSGAGR